MAQVGCICTTSTLVGCSTNKSKHTDNYFIEKNYFNCFIKGGGARKKEAVSAKRLKAATVYQQRCCNLISSSLDDKLRLNRYS